jgi:peroxiredoxin Q/BCP
LVQLQADLAKIEAAGVRLVAISYDPVDVLAKFTAERKITFPLLSDPDSKTIQAYGTLNKEAAGKAAGVPNPGTFILDSQGIVRAKIFLEGYRSRHSTDELLQAAKSVKD